VVLISETLESDGKCLAVQLKFCMFICKYTIHKQLDKSVHEPLTSQQITKNTVKCSMHYNF